MSTRAFMDLPPLSPRNRAVGGASSNRVHTPSGNKENRHSLHSQPHASLPRFQPSPAGKSARPSRHQPSQQQPSPQRKLAGGTDSTSDSITIIDKSDGGDTSDGLVHSSIASQPEITSARGSALIRRSSGSGGGNSSTTTVSSSTHNSGGMAQLAASNIENQQQQELQLEQQCNPVRRSSHPALLVTAVELSQVQLQRTQHNAIDFQTPSGSAYGVVDGTGGASTVSRTSAGTTTGCALAAQHRHDDHYETQNGGEYIVDTTTFDGYFGSIAPTSHAVGDSLRSSVSSSVVSSSRCSLSHERDDCGGDNVRSISQRNSVPASSTVGNSNTADGDVAAITTVERNRNRKQQQQQPPSRLSTIPGWSTGHHGNSSFGSNAAVMAGPKTVDSHNPTVNLSNRGRSTGELDSNISRALEFSVRDSSMSHRRKTFFDGALSTRELVMLVMLLVMTGALVGVWWFRV